MNRTHYGTALVSWKDAADALSDIRRRVFIDEQGVPPELEWDGLDTSAMHVMATSREGEAIGTARLLPDGQIGRMAVLAQWRGTGVGTAMLQRLIAHAPVRERLFL